MNAAENLPVVNELKTFTIKSTGIEIPIGGGNYLGKTICVVHAEISAYSLKMTSYGENVTLHGDITAVNPFTGEVFTSNTGYLPDDYARSIAKQLDERKNISDIVIIDTEIVCVGSEKGARKYAFVTRNPSTKEVKDQRQRNILALSETVKGMDLPQLEAPNEEKKTK